jgi:hypothetical protein
VWGNRDDRTSRLPRTGWCRLESFEEGKWNHLQPESVDIPALMGVERGVWFSIDGGMKGFLVHDEQNNMHIYMLTQQATPEYEAHTHHARMPVFTGHWTALKVTK